MFNKKSVEKTIESALRNTLANHSPEPSHMPFHTRLLGKDRMVLYSFIHSLSANFETTILEKAAVAIADDAFDTVEVQYKINGVFTEKSQHAISRIINELYSGSRAPDHEKEIAEIAMHVRSENLVKKNLRDVSIFLEKDDVVFLIDLKTAKPNVAAFNKYKQDMLEWAAAILHQSPDKNVRTIIAIPYNPYEPKPYKRWMLRGMLEIENQSQIIVGEEFWNFLAGGKEIYQDLLDCFERVGSKMRNEIDNHFNLLGDVHYK